MYACSVVGGAGRLWAAAWGRTELYRLTIWEDDWLLKSLSLTVSALAGWRPKGTRNNSLRAIKGNALIFMKLSIVSGFLRWTLASDSEKDRTPVTRSQPF